MNLLIEQRPTTITSKIQQKLTKNNDVNNSLSPPSSPLILKIKRQTANQQTDLDSTSLPMINEDNNNNSRLTTHNQRLKRPITTNQTTTVTTRRPSSPAFNGKQQQQQQTVTKRSVTIDNNNNDLNPTMDENSSKKRFKQDDLNQSSTTKVDASVETVSIGLATEPDQLGPCEPGTSVVLEGIVWNETDNGVLVVNVTWRGKTYVGTLLDSTKQDWACPRLTCESPTSDYDARNTSKSNRAKRTNTTGNSRCSNYQTNQQITSTNNYSGSEDRKLRHNIKSRQSKRINSTANDDLIGNHSSPLASPFRTNQSFFPSQNQETQLVSCSEPQCHKQFVSTIALKYHLSSAHKKTESATAATETTTTTTPTTITITTAATTTTAAVPLANTRDEEDVAHILANVADYVRRPSPHSSPEHQRQTTLTWPCPQISSNLVRSSPLNNTEQTSNLLSTNPTRCILNNNETIADQDEIKNSVKSTDHFLLQIQDEPIVSSSSWTNSNTDQPNNIDNKKALKIPTPSPSSLVPINLNPTIPVPPKSSSPAYSDISDEDTTNDNEQNPPSTINLLAATNGKLEDNDQALMSNPAWRTQMFLQQYTPYMQQQQAVVDKDLTTNGLNSKTTPNGTSDATVKNILDSRRLSTSKPPSPSSLTSSTTMITNDPTSLLNDYRKNLFHFHTTGISNDSKLFTPIVNSLTSPNENLLNLTTPKPPTTNALDYSLNTTSSSSIHPSR